MSPTARAVGLAAGFAADVVLGDPSRGHPVAAFGKAAAVVEQCGYGDSRAAGVRHLVVTAGPVILAGVAQHRLARRTFMAEVISTAAVTWVCLGATSLAREGEMMARLLADGELEMARARLSHLCARSADGLSADDLARGTVESLAENTSDAVVGTMFWGAVAGVPGMLAHRVVNTLDAMIGYRNQRYRHFGWAAARLDDVVNLVPARLTGVLFCALAKCVGGHPRRAWTTMRRDCQQHPSPNGGWCEAAVAGALGRRLGGRNDYGGQVEDRPVMGDGCWPQVGDIAPAVRLTRLVGIAAAGLATLGALWYGLSSR